MTREELGDGLRDGTILLVDVREDHEFAAGHIPGSVSHPLSRFSPGSLEADGRRVVFSCAAGVRSVHAVAICRAAGLDFREHYPEGFKGWVAAGGPVSSG